MFLFLPPDKYRSWFKRYDVKGLWSSRRCWAYTFLFTEKNIYVCACWLRDADLKLWNGSGFTFRNPLRRYEIFMDINKHTVRWVSTAHPTTYHDKEPNRIKNTVRRIQARRGEESFCLRHKLSSRLILKINCYIILRKIDLFRVFSSSGQNCLTNGKFPKIERIILDHHPSSCRYKSKQPKKVHTNPPTHTHIHRTAPWGPQKRSFSIRLAEPLKFRSSKQLINSTIHSPNWFNYSLCHSLFTSLVHLFIQPTLR